MDHIFKYILALILLQIFLLICLYNTVSKNSITKLNVENIQVRKRNQDSSYTKAKVYTSTYGEDLMKKKNSTAFDHREGIVLDTSETITSACWFYFDQKSFKKAKIALSKKRSFYLFYINLEGDTFNHFSSIERDDLLHWQYVSKEDKFLVQLPVDFDMISFGLLNFDHEETVLNIRLVFNNTVCIGNFSDAMLSIRALLWNDLFKNNTDFYLCNRHYEEHVDRFWLYYITTIWIGYDLSCSEIVKDVGISEFQLVKDEFPIITPIFCFLMSLQFVWIFVLLDIKIVNQESLETPSRQPAKTESHRPYNFYKNHDRPYGIKRIIIKLLYYKPLCESANQNVCFRILYRLLFPQPLTRFIFLVWMTILLPSGCYRTYERYRLGKTIYYDYFDVVFPSEPIVYCLRKYFSSGTAVILDTIYAVVFPLLLILFFRKPQKISILFERFCSRHSDTGNNNGIVSEEKTKFRELFFSPCFSLFKIVCCKHCKRNLDCMWNFCLPVYLILCLFPVIPFLCAWPERYHRICCKNCTCVNGQQTWYIICWGKMLKCVSVCFAFTISYLFYFRPIISTFTFLFRALTYLLCVALPIRVHILQFTLIIGSVIAYILNYFCEFINMNTEILGVISELQRRQNDTKKKTSNVFNETEVQQLDSDALALSKNITKISFEIETESKKISKLEITTTNGDNMVTGTTEIPETNEINEEETGNNLVSALNPETNGINEENEEHTAVETTDEVAGSSSNKSAQNERTYSETEQIEYVSEEKFTKIHEQLSFVKEKLYFSFFKCLFVIVYFVITAFTFILYKKATDAPNFHDVFGIVLLIIGPYAISIFMKTNEKSYLNEENKSEITKAFNSYESTERNSRTNDASQQRRSSSADESTPLESLQS